MTQHERLAATLVRLTPVVHAVAAALITDATGRVLVKPNYRPR